MEEQKKKALEWFNSLNPNVKGNFIFNSYQLYSSLNDQGNFQGNNQQGIFQGNSFQGNSYLGPFNEIKEQIRDLESKLISNHSKGIIGENWVYDYMKDIPGVIIKNVTREKGLTDFYFEFHDSVKMISGLIESKNVDKVSQLHLENFKKDVIDAINNEFNVSFAFFIAHKAVSINGIDMEIIEVNQEKVILFYIYDLFNHPDRFLTALNIAKTLTVNIDLPIDKIKLIVNRIDEISSDIRAHKRLINKQLLLIKNSEANLKNMFKLLETKKEKNEIEEIKDTDELEEEINDIEESEEEFEKKPKPKPKPKTKVVKKKGESIEELLQDTASLIQNFD